LLKPIVGIELPARKSSINSSSSLSGAANPAHQQSLIPLASQQLLRDRPDFIRGLNFPS
jgi:hypothetical protein